MKLLLKIFVALLLVAMIGVGVFHEPLARLYSMVTFYDRDKIVENFSNTDRSFLTVEIGAGQQPALSDDKRDFSLPKSFVFNGKTLDTQQFISDTDTTALVALIDGEIAYEQYRLGTQQNDKRISFSTAKSFLSILVGIALDEKLLPSIDVRVVDYVPSLKGTSYDDATLEDLLEMSSGVAFNENYRQFDSDINRMSRLLALGGSLDEFAGTLAKQRPAGSAMQYVSVDTHVVGMVLRAATNQPIADYFYDKLWRHIGGDHGAYYGTDSTGQPVVLGGLNMRTRDYARLGLLVLNDGAWQGKQVVSRHWIQRSTTTGKDRLKPTETEFGYGYQWWIPPHVKDEVLAVGIYGQYIYINKALNIVIAKNSADIEFMQDGYISKHQTLAMFRAIATKLYMHSTMHSLADKTRDSTKYKNLKIQMSVQTASQMLRLDDNDQSLFEIGSASKWFTALTVLNLLEGQLDKPLTTWLSAGKYAGLCRYQGEDCFGQLTPISLLHHTNAIVDYLNVYGDDQVALEKLGDHTKVYSHEDLYQVARQYADDSTQPNDRWSYSNTGYLILADLIEEVSGMPWRTQVNHYVTVPAKLNDTYFGEELTDQQRARRLQGYYGQQPTQIAYSLASSAGEMLATDQDLHRFLSWWQQSNQMPIQSDQGYVEMVPGLIDYGLGVMRYKTLVGHAGQTFGFQAYIGADVTANQQVVVLANNASYDAMGTALQLYEAMQKLPYQQ